MKKRDLVESVQRLSAVVDSLAREVTKQSERLYKIEHNGQEPIGYGPSTKAPKTEFTAEGYAEYLNNLTTVKED